MAHFHFPLSLESIKQIFEHSTTAIAVFKPDGALEYCNSAFSKAIGRDHFDVNHEGFSLIEDLDIELDEQLTEKLAELPHKPVRVDKVWFNAAGDEITVPFDIIGEFNFEGELIRYIIHVANDCSETEVLSEETFHNHLINNSNDSIFIVEPKNGRILNCNQSAHRTLGYSKIELLKKTIPDINPNYKSQSDWTEKISFITESGGAIFESSLETKNGRCFATEVSVKMIQYDFNEYLMAIVRDISQRKNKEKVLEELAHLDSLTKVANRRKLELLFEELVEFEKDSNTFIGVAYVDIDDFKEINDKHGHLVGDNVLIETASRLKSSIRNSDFVARIGGDEFLVVLIGLSDTKILKQLMEKIAAEFTPPYIFDGQEIKVNISIGVAKYTSEIAKIETTSLIQQADAAMYKSKKHAGTRVFYAF